MDEREIIFDDVPQIAFGFRIKQHPNEPKSFLLLRRGLCQGVLWDEGEHGWGVTKTPHDKPSERLPDNYASPFMAILALKEAL